jgi:hypothetical protein
MGYMHIKNLYADQTILLFKDVYALEKIHGTSAHVGWKAKEKKVYLFSGGCSGDVFRSLFNRGELHQRFSDIFPLSDAIIYGEAYGGKIQHMSATYGKQVRFVAFEVRVGEVWLNVPNAKDVADKFGIEFVPFEKVSGLPEIDNERDRVSIQAHRNGNGDFMREGVVLRPIEEMTKSNGQRVIAKHKNAAFSETKTPREVTPEQAAQLSDATKICDEWVTEMRLVHVLDKLPQGIGMEKTIDVINAMVEDVVREAEHEILDSKAVRKMIGTRTAKMFKAYLEGKLK